MPADLLLAQIDALEQELDKLRRQSDARQYHLEQVQQELLLAARLQRDFLPKRLPDHGDVRFGRLFRPAGHVSGDLYDVRRLDERHAGVYIADAVGHGMPAALLAMFMHNALQTKRIDAGGYRLLAAEEAMTLLNGVLCAQDLSHATFATAAYAVVDYPAGRVRVARGGHPYPILLRPGHAATDVGGEGALLGIMPDEVFTGVDVELQPGDKIVFYTDGVEAAFGEPGAVPDIGPFYEIVARYADRPAETLLTDLAARLDARGTPADDVTLVTVERVGS